MDNILNKIKAIDSEKMYKAISSFPEQIKKSYEIMEKYFIVQPCCAYK